MANSTKTEVVVNRDARALAENVKQAINLLGLASSTARNITGADHLAERLIKIQEQTMKSTTHVVKQLANLDAKLARVGAAKTRNAERLTKKKARLAKLTAEIAKMEVVK